MCWSVAGRPPYSDPVAFQGESACGLARSHVGRGLRLFRHRRQYNLLHPCLLGHYSHHHRRHRRHRQSWIVDQRTRQVLCYVALMRRHAQIDDHTCRMCVAFRQCEV